MEDQNIMGKISAFVKNSASLKIGIIVVLALLLFIPIAMVRSLIDERDDRQNQVVNEVSSKWGASQIIAGPALTIPYKVYIEQQDKKPREVIRYAHFLPDSLSVAGQIEPGVRYRGIYEALLYNSELEIHGEFTLPDLVKFSIAPENVLWQKAFVSMGISDMGGIRSQINGTFAGTDIVFEPGVVTNDLFASGVSAGVLLGEGKTSLAFKFFLGVNGSKNLSFLPLGKETEVSLASTWPSPSFSGRFLPVKRTVSADGFSANWHVLHLNRNYPQNWLGKQCDLSDSAFGVYLHPGTEIYQKSMRTVKYGSMFILFTFTAFFLAEVIQKIRIHPIQYLLVGCGVTIFYVLLIALSEHCGFNISFFLAAVAVICLIGGYVRSIISKQMALAVCLTLTILYSYLFVTLQLEDYALIFGGLGLFSTLAMVMYLTRNINWYSSHSERDTS